MKILAAQRLNASKVSDALAKEFFSELQRHGPYFANWSLNATYAVTLSPPIDLRTRGYEGILPSLTASLEKLGWHQSSRNATAAVFTRNGNQWPLMFSKDMMALELEGDVAQSGTDFPGFKALAKVLKAAGYAIDISRSDSPFTTDRQRLNTQSITFTAHATKGSVSEVVTLIVKALKKTYKDTHVEEEVANGAVILFDSDRARYNIASLGARILVSGAATLINPRASK